jgi:hypothetical protein
VHELFSARQGEKDDQVHYRNYRWGACYYFPYTKHRNGRDQFVFLDYLSQSFSYDPYRFRSRMYRRVADNRFKPVQKKKIERIEIVTTGEAAIDSRLYPMALPDSYDKQRIFCHLTFRRCEYCDRVLSCS